MHALWQFISLADPNTRLVVIGTALLTSASALVGSFTFLRKRALTGDAVAHAVLPGVCLAFMLQGEKNPWVLLAGAFITGWLSLIAMDALSRYTKVKEDTALALVLSVFFGIGILLLTMLQHSGNGAQSGLDKFLFGKAAAITEGDLWAFGSVAALLLLVTALLFKEFSLLSFDADFATAAGLPMPLLRGTLTTLTVLAVVVGIQAVGVVLMAAMLVTPAAAARYWTDRLGLFVILAMLFGLASGLVGAYVSYAIPNMPTGPSMVLAASLLAVLSLLFAPHKGLVARTWRQQAHRKQVQNENTLKALFQLNEGVGLASEHTHASILQKRIQQPQVLSSTLQRLMRAGLVVQHAGSWRLTANGEVQARRVVKLHRLWEMYLTQMLRLPPDHVHDDAETMEHLLTPELEAELEHQLAYPVKDPHDKPIPYTKKEQSINT